ncbi:MAG: hypothetical protein RLN86_08840 [Cyclobacteriaceae bacterium]
MKILTLLIPFFSLIHAKAYEPNLVCIKKNNAQNICYYNFEIDGDKYHFMDIGCKYSKEKLMKKIGKGTIALAKDWKIPC